MKCLPYCITSCAFSNYIPQLVKKCDPTMLLAGGSFFLSLPSAWERKLYFENSPQHNGVRKKSITVSLSLWTSLVLLAVRERQVRVVPLVVDRICCVIASLNCLLANIWSPFLMHTFLLNSIFGKYLCNNARWWCCVDSFSYFLQSKGYKTWCITWHRFILFTNIVYKHCLLFINILLDMQREKP